MCYILSDVDECARSIDSCDPNALCTNSLGSYQCQCNSGWLGNGTYCSDINECEFRSLGCHPRAVCTNSLGSYDCTCPVGYSGNGETCIGKYYIAAKLFEKVLKGN